MTKIRKLAAYIIIICILILISKIIMTKIYPMNYYNIVKANCQTYDMDPLLIMSIIKAESNFKPEATSKKNAKGLMQLRDDTALWCAEKMDIDLKTENLYNGETNIKIGVWYFDYLMEHFDQKVDLCLAAYNAGMGNVNKWLDDEKLSSNGVSLKDIPFKETENYINKVMNNYKIYKFLYGDKIQ